MKISAFFVLILFLVVAFFSCGRASVDEDLYGYWSVTRYYDYCDQKYVDLDTCDFSTGIWIGKGDGRGMFNYCVYDGCNSDMGSYSIASDGKVKWVEGSSTLVYCPREDTYYTPSFESMRLTIDKQVENDSCVSSRLYVINDNGDTVIFLVKEISLAAEDSSCERNCDSVGVAENEFEFFELE